jgi:hypothetical protein
VWAQQLPIKPFKRSQTEFKDIFGKNASAELHLWLKSKLLICTDPYYNFETGICKTYTKNRDGIKELSNRLNGVPIAPALQQQLDTGLFEYTEKSNRLWNPLQIIPKRFKRPLMVKNGYPYHYDICCAAPTLIRQYAGQLGLTKATPAIDLYIQDRTAVRQRIAQDGNIPEGVVKQVVNALFQGGKLGVNKDFTLYHLIGDVSKIKWLQQDEFIVQLKKDIKVCWDVIKPSVTSNTLTPRDKSGVYMMLEKQVMSYVRRYMKKKKNLCLLEHDGWFCEKVIDLNELIPLIKSKTSFQLSVEWTIYDDIII